jgi:hypothetical protein
MNISQIDIEEFEQWKALPISRIVMQLHKDRKADLLTFIQDAALSSTVLSEVEQARFHVGLGLYDDFIELTPQDIFDYYEDDGAHD